MTAVTVLLWTLIILGVIAVARYVLIGGDRAPQARPTAEELLAERFARGEIDEQEYRQRQEALHGRSGTVIKS
jgi:putative membrane protein